MVGGIRPSAGVVLPLLPPALLHYTINRRKLQAVRQKICAKKVRCWGVYPARHRRDLAVHVPGGELAFFAARQPCLSLAFLPPIPPTPFPSGEGGAPKFISPGASPPAPLHLTACGTHRACQAGTRRGACPVGRLLPLPLSFFSAPYPPDPLPRRGRGRPRLFHARGFAPCIPAPEPEAALARRALAVPAGAHRGLVASSPCRPCPRRGEGGRKLNPGGTYYSCPGGEDHLKRRSSSPPVPPLLGCRHCS